MNPVSLGSRSYKRCVNQLISKNLTKSSHQIFHSISRFSSAPSSGASHGMPSLLCVFLSCVWEMFKVKCDTFPVNMTPLLMCNSMLTTRSAHNSGLDIDKPSHWLGHCPHCPNVWSRGYKGNAHTENSKARPGLVLLYLNILVFQLR